MIARWGRSSAGERHAVPVELRFIDMFMATVGALIFMAMLFAWVIGNTRSDDLVKVDPPPGTMPLTLLTKALPHAQIGQRYDVALAYRGGTAPIRWDIESGSKEIPAGMRFVDNLGAIRGIPTREMTARFVVVLRDAAGARVRQPYELRIDPRPMAAKNIEMVLFAAIVVASAWWWLRAFRTARGWGKTAEMLANAFHRGQTRVKAPVGSGVEQAIELPSGIIYYSGLRDTAARNSRIIGGLTVLLAVAWSVRWLLR